MKKRILVTGGSSGIGRAIAITLAEAGFDIAINFRSSEIQAEEVAEIIRSKGSNVSLLRADIANREQIFKSIEDDINKNGAYWGVIANAGVTSDAPMPALLDEDWDRVLHTNLDGFYNVVKPCLMPMIHLRQGGRIIAITSISGVIGNRGQTNYSASKGGIIAACKSLSLELAKRKITVNTVSPGLIETKMVTDDIKDHVLPLIPLGRMGHVDEVASLVKFLCSDEASYITRQNININGGMC